MKTILKTTIGILAILAVALAIPSAAVQATFSPVGGTTYYLASSIGSTNTTITLSSLTNRSGVRLTMSNTNTDIMYATIDPQSSNSEFISFTGISQNSNGSATLTGVTRGLSDIYPFTASSTLRQPHSGRAPFILSDAPQVFNQYAVKQNDETITGDWLVPTPASPTSIVNRNYVNGLIFGGIGGASETATGTVEMATAAEAALGTTNGTAGRLALGSNLSTSTWTPATGNGNVVTTGVSGKIDNNFISTSTLIANNGITYTLPSARGASSTVLTENGSGVLFFEPTNLSLLISTTTAQNQTHATTTTFTGRQHIMVYVYHAGCSIASIPTLQLNGKTASAYGYANSVDGGSSLKTSSADGLVIADANNSTTSPMFAMIDIENISGNRKFLVWRATYSSASAMAPATIEGSGVWNDTSGPVTNISISCALGSGGATVLSGTKINVYGSNY